MRTMKLSDYIAEIEREAMDEAVGISIKVSNLSDVDRDAAIKLMDSIIEYLSEKKHSL